jgi:Acetyl-CoA acetyltransferase
MDRIVSRNVQLNTLKLRNWLNNILNNFTQLPIFYFPGIFIVAAKRTPFGTYGGKFTKTSSTQLQTVAAKAALEEGKINPELVDSVVIGNVLAVSNKF